MILCFFLIFSQLTQATHEVGDSVCRYVYIGDSPSNTRQTVDTYYNMSGVECPTIVDSSNSYSIRSSENFTGYTFSVSQSGNNVTVDLVDPGTSTGWSFYLSFDCPVNCSNPYTYPGTNYTNYTYPDPGTNYTNYTYPDSGMNYTNYTYPDPGTNYTNYTYPDTGTDNETTTSSPDSGINDTTTMNIPPNSRNAEQKFLGSRPSSCTGDYCSWSFYIDGYSQFTSDYIGLYSIKAEWFNSSLENMTSFYFYGSDTDFNNYGTVLDLMYIEPGTFQNCPDIEWVTFTYTNLKIVEVGVFDELSYLRELDLKRNSIHTLEYGAFPNTIKYLDLSDNVIERIPDRMFQGFANLTSLKLSSNMISSIGDDTFKGMRVLNQLLLGDNRISSFGDAFDLMSMVQGALAESWNDHDDRHRRLTHDLPPGAGTTSTPEEMLEYHTIDLIDNGLSVINATMLNKLPSLELFRASYNAIERIESGAFDGLSELHTIMLDHNLLHTIESFTFRGHVSISVILLNHNRITHIKSYAFSNITKGGTLLLHANRIERIEPYVVIYMFSFYFLFSSSFFLLLK